MSVVISQNDLKTNILILWEFNKTQRGPLAVAAKRLMQLWMTQLTEQARRDLSLAGVNLEGF